MKQESGMQSTQISKSSNFFLNIFMIILAVLCLYPLLLVLGVSLTSQKGVQTNGYRLIPSVFSLDAYTFIFSDAEKIMRAYGVSFFVTIVGSILSVFIIVTYAYPISREDFRYKRIFNFIVFFTMLFNGGLIPLYFVYVRVLHLKDSLAALILMGLITPLYVMIVKTYFRTSIPESVIEAARIDGAGELKTFFEIVLPLAKPVLATIIMFDVLWYWNDWYSPMLYITDENLFNLQYLMLRIEKNIQFLVSNSGIASQAGGALAKMPSETARMAMAVIAIGPVIIAYPFFQKYFVSGITLGASKE